MRGLLEDGIDDEVEQPQQMPNIITMPLSIRFHISSLSIGLDAHGCVIPHYRVRSTQSRMITMGLECQLYCLIQPLDSNFFS